MNEMKVNNNEFVIHTYTVSLKKIKVILFGPFDQNIFVRYFCLNGYDVLTVQTILSKVGIGKVFCFWKECWN